MLANNSTINSTNNAAVELSHRPPFFSAKSATFLSAINQSYLIRSGNFPSAIPLFLILYPVDVSLSPSTNFFFTKFQSQSSIVSIDIDIRATNLGFGKL